MGCEVLGVGIGPLLACPQPIWASSAAWRWSPGMWSSAVEISKSSSVRCSPRRARDLSPLGLHDSSPAQRCTFKCIVQGDAGGNDRLHDSSPAPVGNRMKRVHLLAST